MEDLLSEMGYDGGKRKSDVPRPPVRQQKRHRPDGVAPPLPPPLHPVRATSAPLSVTPRVETRIVYCHGGCGKCATSVFGPEGLGVGQCSSEAWSRGSIGSETSWANPAIHDEHALPGSIEGVVAPAPPVSGAEYLRERVIGMSRELKECTNDASLEEFRTPENALRALANFFPTPRAMHMLCVHLCALMGMRLTSRFMALISVGLSRGVEPSDIYARLLQIRTNIGIVNPTVTTVPRAVPLLDEVDEEVIRCDSASAPSAMASAVLTPAFDDVDNEVIH